MLCHQPKDAYLCILHILHILHKLVACLLRSLMLWFALKFILSTTNRNGNKFFKDSDATRESLFHCFWILIYISTKYQQHHFCHYELTLLPLLLESPSQLLQSPNVLVSSINIYYIAHHAVQESRYFHNSK